MKLRPGRISGVRTPLQRAGAAAEAAACDYLVERGMRIVARNVRYQVGELDIVAADGALLVFVEVRRRANDHFGGAKASVSGAKRSRLVRAAQVYLLEHHGQRWPACRFDVVAFESGRLEWIVDAFGTEEKR
jgi:putative endonuclease